MMCARSASASPDASRPRHFSRSHNQLVRRSTTQDGSGRHDDAALDDILQLPDISRPVVLFQREHQFLRDLIDCFALLFGKPTDEMFRQQPDISSPFAERRNRDRKHAQAVIEVGAEFLLFHHTAQVLICRGDDPHVGVKGMAAAQAFELLFLEHPEQLRLQFQWKIADLVQEKRAPVGGLEPSDGLRHSAGECAPFATEELALQQGIRYRRATECDETILAPWAALVNRPGNQFLASPGLALNQDGRIERRDHVDVAEQSTKLRAASDQI